MAFYNNETVSKIEERATIRYIDQALTRGWNQNRRGTELRLLTGWSWTERGGNRRSQAGLKTKSAALRDAYYVLVDDRAQPADVGRRPKLRMVG